MDLMVALTEEGDGNENTAVLIQALAPRLLWVPWGHPATHPPPLVPTREGLPKIMGERKARGGKVPAQLVLGRPGPRLGLLCLTPRGYWVL